MVAEEVARLRGVVAGGVAEEEVERTRGVEEEVGGRRAAVDAVVGRDEVVVAER